MIVGRRFSAGLRKPNKNICDESRWDDRKVREAHEFSRYLAMKRLSQKSDRCPNRATIGACRLSIALPPTLFQGERGLFRSRFWSHLALWERNRVRAFCATIPPLP